MEHDEQALPAFICPISLSIMRDPVSTADGHSYERAIIESWLHYHDTSPLTGEVLPHKHLSPNFALLKAIEEWEEKHGMHVKLSNIELEEPPIASGTFKTVHQGWLNVHGQKVRVAVMKLRHGSCATEARTFLKLGRHPRLVRFFGQSIEGETQLLLTELAPYGSLSDAFESIEGKLSTAHALVMMHQVCQLPNMARCTCARGRFRNHQFFFACAHVSIDGQYWV
jgi:hypothetical protein